MEKYRDIDRDSGVVGFEISTDSIKIEFSDGSRYLYTYGSAGENNVERMKKLATNGDGLNAFISTHVRNQYYSKEK